MAFSGDVNLRDLFEAAPNGVLRLRELRPHVSRGQLAKLVGTGLVIYEGRGTYRLRTTREEHAIARQLCGVLSHRSAAVFHRLQLATAVGSTEITVDPRRSRINPPEGVRVYYRPVRPDEQEGGVTTVVRTILDCARDLSVPDALTMADAAVRAGDVDRDVLAEAAARRRGPGSARVRRVIGWLDPRSASVLESVTRGVLLEGGIRGFEPQFPVKISTGEMRHADLGHERARLLIEAESFLAHSGPVMERDALRYTEFAAAGYGLLRFTWVNVMYRRPWVVEMVRSALEQRGVMG